MIKRKLSRFKLVGLRRTKLEVPLPSGEDENGVPMFHADTKIN
jgi:hypothetical protein